MRYYPAFLDLRGRPCVVVGGGAVAWRKAKALIECGARVTVVSPDGTPALAASARRGAVRWTRRRVKASDLTRAWLIVAATNDPSVNRLAARSGKLVNVVDQPALCTFIVPSIVRRGRLTIAISTAGDSPTVSKWIRQDLTARYAPFGTVVSRMRRRRRAVHAQVQGMAPRRRRLEAALREELRRVGIAR